MIFTWIANRPISSKFDAGDNTQSLLRQEPFFEALASRDNEYCFSGVEQTARAQLMYNQQRQHRRTWRDKEAKS